MSIDQADEGLLWQKIDLHVHTPASMDDYKNAGTTAKDIIDKCESERLTAICITDHNTGDWIDLIKTAAAKSKITIFPGVEITAQGGKRNIHVLALLDPSQGTSEINDILSKLNITTERRGRTDVLADGDLHNVFRVITESGGVALLAHVDSESGAMHDMRGVTRIKVIQNPMLLGAQITQEETAKYLDGKDPNYQRKLATFYASDAHCVDEIGIETSFFKMGDMTLSSLKQCLYDPETRIKSTIENLQHPLISKIECSQGFFIDQHLQLHYGLNSIIGGKGVGKSLIIEFLRFALDHWSPIKQIQEDMQNKLKYQLGTGGEINVYIQTYLGTQYKVTRKYDGILNPITITNISEDCIYEGDLHALFPVLVYSQNEVIEIARNQSAQLALIDNLVDIAQHNSNIEEIKLVLKKNSNQYLESLESKQRIAEINKEMATVKESIKGVDKVLNDPMFKQKKKWDHETQLFESVQQVVTNLTEIVRTSAIDCKSIKFSHMSTSDIKETELKTFSKDMQLAQKELVQGINNALKNFESKINSSKEHIEIFNQKHSKWKKQYDRFLAKAGGHYEALAGEREQLQRRLNTLIESYTSVKESADNFAKIDKGRKELLTKLDEELLRRYESRKLIYKKISEASNGRLKLTIKHGEDKSSFNSALIQFAYGTRLRTQYIQIVAEKMTPRQFAQATLTRDINSLCAKTELDTATITKLVDAIVTNDVKTHDVLDLPYTAIPEDVPDIQYLKDDGAYYPLDQISVGQKCTALLSIALSEGLMPIIIDQPEDALDVATVYYDIVSLLRRNKEHRQFILTTHNPNIAVTSDSDKYHVLKATGSSGQIACCGAIDLEEIRPIIIEHMEGGIDPYRLRGRKYNVVSN